VVGLLWVDLSVQIREVEFIRNLVLWNLVNCPYYRGVRNERFICTFINVLFQCRPSTVNHFLIFQLI